MPVFCYKLLVIKAFLGLEVRKINNATKHVFFFLASLAVVANHRFRVVCSSPFSLHQKYVISMALILFELYIQAWTSVLCFELYSPELDLLAVFCLHWCVRQGHVLT